MRWLAGGCLALLLSACTYRTVTISSEPTGAMAQVVVKPKYRVGTPGSLNLPARHDYQIEVDKEGYEPAFVNVPANSDWWALWPVNRILAAQGRYDTSYSVTLEPKRPVAPATWENTSNGFERCSDAYIRDFGADVSSCRGKAYVGSESQGKGRSSGAFSQYGGIAGSSAEMSSHPVFDNALFVACMLGEGWHKVVLEPPQRTCTSEIQ